MDSQQLLVNGDYVACQHRVDGKCDVVRKLSSGVIDWSPSPVECYVCTAVDHSQQLNCITGGAVIKNVLSKAGVSEAIRDVPKRVLEYQSEYCKKPGEYRAHHVEFIELLGTGEAGGLESGSLNEGQSGPGTELKQLISWFAKENEGCSCKDRQRKMNAWGVEGCRKRKSTIVGWLMEEGAKRGWPTGKLTQIAAGVLVETAIRNAERKERKRAS